MGAVMKSTVTPTNPTCGIWTFGIWISECTTRRSELNLTRAEDTEYARKRAMMGLHPASYWRLKVERKTAREEKKSDGQSILRAPAFTWILPPHPCGTSLSSSASVRLEKTSVCSQAIEISIRSDMKV